MCRFSFSSIEQQYVAESLQTLSRHHGYGAGKRRKCGHPSTYRKEYPHICPCTWHDQEEPHAKGSVTESKILTRCENENSVHSAEQKDVTLNLVLQNSRQHRMLW